MTCQQIGCSKKAKYIVYWPSRTTHQCEEHMNKAVDIAQHMGFPLHVEEMKEDESQGFTRTTE